MMVSLSHIIPVKYHCTDRKVDAICATTFHQSGRVLATASGQQHQPIDLEGLSGDDEEHEESLSKRHHVELRSEIFDNSLKIWIL